MGVIFVPAALVSEQKRGWSWSKQAGTREDKMMGGMTVSQEMKIS